MYIAFVCKTHDRVCLKELTYDEAHLENWFNYKENCDYQSNDKECKIEIKILENSNDVTK